MNNLARLDPLLTWLTVIGFPAAELEPQGSLLIVKLPPSDRSRLLAAPDLRREFVSRAKALGFSRLCLDLPP